MTKHHTVFESLQQFFLPFYSNYPIFITSIIYVFCSKQLSEILKFGIDKLLSSDESSIQEVILEKILGSSRGGQWMDDEDLSLLKEEEEAENESESEMQSMF